LLSEGFDHFIAETQELSYDQGELLDIIETSDDIRIEGASATSPRYLIDFDVSGATRTMGSLWQEFLGSITSGITIEGNHPNNPVVKHLISSAPSEPPLFSAVMFLSCSVRSAVSPQSQEPGQSEDTMLLAQVMERKALDLIDSAEPSLYANAPAAFNSLLNSLSVLFALCAAYIAQGKGENS
jgi:hypothetical protein